MSPTTDMIKGPGMPEWVSVVLLIKNLDVQIPLEPDLTRVQVYMYMAC